MSVQKAETLRRAYRLDGLREYALAALCGGVGYCALEVLWRGWTHISMALCGAACFLFFYYLEKRPRFRAFLLVTRALFGGLVITAVEFAAGCVVNLGLGLDVWSYEGMPYNLLGQICLPMSALWVVLAGGAFLLCDGMRKFIFRTE